MNRTLAILAVVPLTALMHWVGVGVVAYVLTILEFLLGKEKDIVAPFFNGGLLATIATFFYILYWVAIFKRNLLFHWSVWSLSLVWNAFLLKTEVLGTGPYTEGDVNWFFRAGAVWVLVLSAIFLLSQAIAYAKRKNLYRKYLSGLDKFRALGTSKQKT